LHAQPGFAILALVRKYDIMRIERAGIIHRLFNEVLNMESDELIIEMQAEMMGVLANPKRLGILKVLADNEKTVGDIASELGIELQNASQHLRIMKAHGIVLSRRDGQAVYYSLAMPVIAECCNLVRQAIVENAENTRNVLKGVR
jgi:DNA-binding transcriptional ArsR family regulator